MLRSIFVVWLSFCVPVTIATSSSAADRNKVKPPVPTPAEVAAREHVQQALQAESLGDNAKRTKHLSTASLSQPSLPEANWHLSRVQVAGKWLPLAEAEARASEDENVRKYRQQRDAAKNPKMLLNLARWCAKNGFDDAAQFHYTQLLANSESTDVMRKEAVKKYDLLQVDGVWSTREEVDTRHQEFVAVEAALTKWRPPLKILQLVIDGEDFAKRDEAINELNQINDPAVIPVLESFLLDGGDRFCEAAVELLGEFPQYEATEALARFAVLSDFVAARTLAIESLKKRNLHEFCPLLLGSLVHPIESRFEVVTNNDGSVRYTFVVSKKGPDQDKVFVDQRGWIPLFYRRRFNINPRNEWVKNPEFEIAHNAQVATALNDAAIKNLFVMLANVQPSDTNRRIFAALTATTGVQNPPEADKWWQWWKDYNEYHWPKSSQYAYAWTATCSYLPVPFEKARVGGSCFLTGTPVRTQTGLVAIETIQPGDRVLAQDQDSGELTYKIVLRTTLRPPAEMVKIKAGTEEIVTTLGHPFWVNGHGWRMAKQLKEGDLLHSLGGAMRIDAVEPMPKQPAHNLVVADFNTYFVGNQGLLVHDNEYRKPTRSIVPGLAAAD